MNARHTQNYEAIYQCFITDQFDDCYRLAKTSLEDPILPRYYIIRTSFILACVTEDVDEAERARIVAETQWDIARRLTSSTNEETEASFASLRKELDRLKVNLENSIVEYDADDDDGGDDNQVLIDDGEGDVGLAYRNPLLEMGRGVEVLHRH